MSDKRKVPEHWIEKYDGKNNFDELQIAKQQKELQNVTKQIVDQLPVFSIELEPEIKQFVESQGKLISNIAESLNTIFKPLNENVINGFANATRSLEAQRVSAEKLSKKGWVLPPGFQILRIHEYAAVLSQEELDKKFVDFFFKKDKDTKQTYFDRVEKDLLENKLVEMWRPLLISSIKNINAEDFYVAIPSLLTVLEGLSRKLFTCKSKTEIRNIRSKYQELVNDCQTDHSRFIYLLTVSMVEFISVVFESGRFEKRMERLDIINRDWILHGIDDPKKWNFSDSLKLLNAIHCLITYNIVDLKQPEI